MTQIAADGDLAELIPLQDPSFYARDLDDVHAAFREVRNNESVFWHAPGRFWVLMRHADQRHVGANPQIFSSRFGFQIGDNFPVEQVAAQLPDWAQDQLRQEGLTRAEQRGIIARAKVSIGDPEIESVVVTDPPRHIQHRKVMTNALSLGVIRRFEPTVIEIVDQALDAIEAGSTVEAVDAIARHIPPAVIAGLLGVPKEDTGDFIRWGEAFMATVILNERDPVKAARNKELAGEFSRYIDELIDERRRQPREDLASAIAGSELNGAPVPKKIAMMLIRSLIAGGGDTTRHLLSHILNDLGTRPDQRQLLREQPDLIGNAVNEVLRWSPVVWSEARTALEDTKVGEVPIQEGDFLVMVFPSANRDEEAWDAPFDFDVARKFNVPSMAFGWGEHLCPGNPLARAEGRIFLERVMARFDDFEVAGEAKRFTSSFINGFQELPVLFS